MIHRTRNLHGIPTPPPSPLPSYKIPLPIATPLFQKLKTMLTFWAYSWLPILNINGSGSIWIVKFIVTAELDLWPRLKFHSTNHKLGDLIYQNFRFEVSNKKIWKWQTIWLHWIKEINKFNDLWWPLTQGHETSIRAYPDKISIISPKWSKSVRVGPVWYHNRTQTHRGPTAIII